MKFGLVFKGTVTLQDTYDGVRLIAWRAEGDRRKTYKEHRKRVPYHLAIWMRLMPFDEDRFTDRLYDFSSDDFKQLTVDSQILKITQKKPDIKILTVDITN